MNKDQIISPANGREQKKLDEQRKLKELEDARK